MGARRRALLVLLSLMLGMAGTALLLIAGSGSVDRPKRAVEVAGSSEDVSLFKGEVLVWADGGFSADEVRRIRDSVRVAEISAVRTGLLPVVGSNPAYPVIPVEAIAVDPRAYAAAAGRPGEHLDTLLGTGVVLSRTGAGLRKLGAGDGLRLAGGRSLLVRAVVDDKLLGGYEAAVSIEQGKRFGIDRTGYALVRPRGPLDTLQLSVRRLLGGRQLGFQLPGARLWFRAGDGTLPLAQVKLRFGEFAVKRLADPVPSPAWAAAHLATRVVPVLGEVRCHRLILDDLSAAMAEVEREHLADLVDVAAFQRDGGCLGLQRSQGDQGGLSAAAWGIGFELSSPGGPRPLADQRLVAVMARHGFTWGGRWLRPLADRFEWVGDGA
jgi:hypothetical protein